MIKGLQRFFREKISSISNIKIAIPVICKTWYHQYQKSGANDTVSMPLLQN